MKKKKEYLCEKGLEKDILNGMREEAVNKVYESVIKKGDVTIDAKVESVEKVFVDQTIDKQTRGAIPESQLRITTTLMNYADTKYQYIQGCDLIIDYLWVVSPGATGNDVITLNWNSSVFSLSDYGGPLNAYNYVTNMSTGSQDFYNFISTPAHSNSAGIGWYAQLQSPNISPKIQINPGGWAFVSFEPSYMFHVNDNVVTDLRLEYVHENMPGISSISFSYEGASISAGGNFTDSLSKITTYRSMLVDDWG
ncbi:MAG: hypothetical protein SOX85_05230 [Lachnospiraceae bacterium]|nr:hypothetical protein [Lachnospiraceae bacterium]